MSGSYYEAVGALATSAALAVQALPKDPKWAKQILKDTLRDFEPHALSPEVKSAIREAGVR